MSADVVVSEEEFNRAAEQLENTLANLVLTLQRAQTALRSLSQGGYCSDAVNEAIDFYGTAAEAYASEIQDLSGKVRPAVAAYLDELARIDRIG